MTKNDKQMNQAVKALGKAEEIQAALNSGVPITAAERTLLETSKQKLMVEYESLINAMTV